MITCIIHVKSYSNEKCENGKDIIEETNSYNEDWICNTSWRIHNPNYVD